METLTIAFALPRTFAVYKDGRLLTFGHEEPSRKLLEALGYTVTEGLILLPRCNALTIEFDYRDFQWSPPQELEILLHQVYRYNRRVRQVKMADLRRQIEILEAEYLEAGREEIRRETERVNKE